MISREEHDNKNSLTDPENRWLRLNPSEGMAYIGLPSMLCKVSWAVFILICDRVRYECGKAKDGSDYISIVLTIDELLLNLRSRAYADGKKMDGDRRNYKRYFMDLHKNNVFYVWKCGNYYAFIMEREIRSWLFYNKDGCVIPKTIIKIISRARSMMNDMVRAHSRGDTSFRNRDIESSFGFFMNNVIDKMNPLIAREDLPMWDKGQYIYEYLEVLQSKLEKLEIFDGLTEDHDYIKRLPKYIEDNLKKVNGGTVMMSDLEKEIAPVGNDANLAKKPRKKREKKVADGIGEKTSKQKSILKRYDKPLNPFKDGASFTKYYKAYLHHLSGTTTKLWWEDVSIDNGVAVEIIDLLRSKGFENKEFLNDWIEYFFQTFLKGNKGRKAEYTALRAFLYTFERYKETRHVVSE